MASLFPEVALLDPEPVYWTLDTPSQLPPGLFDDPLLDLPLEPITDNILDIFKTCSISQESYQHVLETTRVHVKCIWIDKNLITITDNENEAYQLWFQRGSASNGIQMNGIQMSMKITPGFSILFVTESEERFWSTMIHLILKVFQAKDWIWNLQAENEISRIRAFTRQLQSLRVLGSAHSRIPLSPESLRILLEDVHVDSSRLAFIQTPRYTGGLIHRKITIREASWLTVDTLMAMDSEELTANGNVRITVEDLNRFLLHWMFWKKRGPRGTHRLRALALFQMTSVPIAKVVRNMGATRWTPPMRLLTRYGRDEIDNDNSWFIRRWDGMLAAVAAVEGCFKMFVFDDMFLEQYEEEEPVEQIYIQID